MKTRSGWDYAQPIAEHNAKLQQISYDEALETLKRVKMVEFKLEKNEPAFWIADKAVPQTVK